MFSYSGGIDENGFWEDITALDYVELFDYLSLSIPGEIHEVSDADIQSEIDNLVASYFPDSRQVLDRAVIDGDTVNIDYVGSMEENIREGLQHTAIENYVREYIANEITIYGHAGMKFESLVLFPDLPSKRAKDSLVFCQIRIYHKLF